MTITSLPRKRSALRALLLPLVLVAAFATVLLGPGASTALASDCTTATNCVVDQQGANDEPNQKDLTRFQLVSSTATTLTVSFNHDDLASDFGGSNTGDGCLLFDTDADGNANYALCTTFAGGQPPTTTLYSCGDERPDRCTTPITVVSPTPGTTCSVSETDTNPFTDPHGTDTTITCTVVLADIDATSATLIDACSYPSQQPNSDPSDCIVASTGGGSTAASFRSLTATKAAGSVLLRWKTAAEADVLGYNVYAQVNGKRVKLNKRLIAGKGVSGGSYAFKYRTPKGKKAPARFWVETVNLDGTRNWRSVRAI